MNPKKTLVTPISTDLRRSQTKFWVIQLPQGHTYIAVPLPYFILIQPTRMQLRYRSQSQTGKSKRSTCHPWWFGEHTEEWRCHPLAHHLGSCPGCCTWDCRNLRTIPAHGRLAHQIRSQFLGCRSEWGWLPRPPATQALHKKTCYIPQPPKPLKLLGPIAYASSCDGQFTCWHVHCMKPGLEALHGSQSPASNETVFFFFASTYPTSSCKLNFPSFGNKNTSYSFETHDLHSTLI